MDSIKKEHLLFAIDEIKNNPSLRRGRTSSTWDLIYDGQDYPPKLIIGIANRFATGKELGPHDFLGGNNQPSFKLLRDFGFELVAKKNPIPGLIKKYKELIKNTQLKDEAYKWELVSLYRGKPDLDAAELLQEVKSIKYGNLMYAMGQAVLYHVIKAKPEEMRLLLRDLFDENKDLTQRIKDYSNRSLELYRSMGETLQHHQDERTIAALLTVRNPEKYTFYKNSFYKKCCQLLKVQEAGKFEKYPHYLSLLQTLIDDYISTDQELTDLVKSAIPEYYNGTNHLLLTQDFLYQMLDKYEEGNEVNEVQESDTPSYIKNMSLNKELEKTIDILRYKKQIILQGPPGTGKTKLAKDIASSILNVNLHDLNTSPQFQLLQFHPSYTYEDFVRGITAKPNPEGGMLYEAEDKVLGKFAKLAHENYSDSKKNLSVLSREHWVKEMFEDFTDTIADYIDQNNGEYPLTDNVDIIRVEDDSFFYIGKTWNGNAHRMPFKDILQAYLDGNSERQHIKQNRTISGSARQHASYYVRVLKLFIDFLKGKTYVENKTTTIEEKKFILVIDEINRANLSTVLGELIYALEYRQDRVESMYEVKGEKFLTLPPNLFIIGTMNTADRSVGHIDYAIRRRFAFIDVSAEDLGSQVGVKFHSSLFKQVSELFDTNLSPEFEKKEVQLGHSYFIDKSSEGGNMNIRLEYEIKPILHEYVKDGILIGKVGTDDIASHIDSLTI